MNDSLFRTVYQKDRNQQETEMMTGPEVISASIKSVLLVEKPKRKMTQQQIVSNVSQHSRKYQILK